MKITLETNNLDLSSIQGAIEKFAAEIIHPEKGKILDDFDIHYKISMVRKLVEIREAIKKAMFYAEKLEKQGKEQES